MLSVGVQVAWAGPSVKTNKSIYNSGETVTITGEGFEKSKSYALAIVWPDGKVYKWVSGKQKPGWDKVKASSKGAFTYRYKMGNQSGLYRVLAYPATWNGDVSQAPLSETTFASADFSIQQTWPRCISGCTANDVTILGVRLDPEWPGSGQITANVYIKLQFQRVHTYCIVVIADWKVGGTTVVTNWVSDIIPYHNKNTMGDTKEYYMGQVTLSGTGSVAMTNILVMWQQNSPPGGTCQANCDEYNAPSKCWYSATEIVAETNLDIIAHKFNDLNGDGDQDAGESDLTGWTMQLFSGSGCSGSPLLTAVTGTGGNAVFQDLAPGDYSIKETVQTGWTATTDTCQNVTRSDNENETPQVNFGNRRAGGRSR